LSNMLLGWVNNEAETEEVESLELTSFCSSPDKPPVRKSTRTKPDTPVVRMACTAGITGVTPGKGTSIAKQHAEFVESCMNCDGTFPSIKSDPEKQDQRMRCCVCKRKTRHFCWKYRQYLCDEPPKNQTGRDGKRFLDRCSVKIPKLKANKRLQRDEEGKVMLQTEHGVLTCYLIAHQE